MRPHRRALLLLSRLGSIILSSCGNESQEQPSSVWIAGSPDSGTVDGPQVDRQGDQTSDSNAKDGAAGSGGGLVVEGGSTGGSAGEAGVAGEGGSSAGGFGGQGASGGAAGTEGGAGGASAAGAGGSTPPQPVGTLKVMTYNIQHGGTLGWNLDAVADTIKAQNPDVVGLNEVQSEMPDSSFKKEAEELATKTGLTNYFFGCTTNCGSTLPGRYGIALLCRWDLTNRDKYFLPNQTDGSLNLESSIEPRVLLCGAIHGGNLPVVRICVTHLTNSDTDEAKQIRVLQAQAIVSHLQADLGPYGNRVVLTGDLNTTPPTEPINILTGLLADSWKEAGAGSGATMPSDAPLLRWDYILHGTGFAAATWAATPNSSASDHLPVVATIPVYGD